MNKDALQAYAMSKGYTDESLIGGGAIKGKNCQVLSTEPIEGGTKVTFVWYLDDGTQKTSSINVMDGKGGSVVSVQQLLNKGMKIGVITVDGVPTILYAPTGSGSSTLDGLEDVDLSEPIDGQVLIYDAEKEEWVNGTISGGSAVLSSVLTTAITVGGIEAGTEYAKDTPLETVIRDMLEPTLYPTLTNPSASMTATGAKLLEKGATLNATFTLTLNRGSINPQYTAESSYRSGSATSYTLDGTSQAGNTFSITVTEAKKSYQGSVAYGAGVQPKDSKGNDYGSPLAAGSVNTNTINYEFVDALWANTANIATVAKLALVSKNAKVKEFNFPAQTVTNPEEFHTPTSWSITAIEVLNTLSNQWENCAGEFTVTDTTHTDAGGNTVNYKKYLCNLGVATGSRKIRIKWS